jgi:hypothetical protein
MNCNDSDHDPVVTAIQTIEAFWRQITAVFQASYRVEVDADLAAMTELACAWGVLEERLEVLRSATSDYAVREFWVLSALRNARTASRRVLEGIRWRPECKASALALTAKLRQVAVRLEPHERTAPTVAPAPAAYGRKEAS